MPNEYDMSAIHVSGSRQLQGQFEKYPHESFIKGAGISARTINAQSIYFDIN
jgi:hypothetical protein